MIDARTRGIPWALWLQDILPDGAATTGLIGSGPLLAALRRLERAAYRSASRIFVISDAFERNLIAKGVPAANIAEEYTPFGHSDYQTIVGKVKAFAKDGDACILSTINGDSNVPFYKEFANQGLTADKCPIMAFSVAEDELRSMETEKLVGHLAAWNYYQSQEGPENKKFVDAFKAYCAKNKLPGGADRVTDDPIEAAYFGVYVWKMAAEKAGTFDVMKVADAVKGMEFNAPGGKKKMDAVNHHTYKPVLIGSIRADGQFDIVSKTDLVKPDSFSSYLHTPDELKKLTGQ
jgi:urea transport system substrate-binding protein